ncbi:MAG TPA: dual specificity protein phosphatase [Vicinamibacteria bacterium]|nr:dual specificity protein phosphatase [Vicinamibacteria bacterium]
MILSPERTSFDRVTDLVWMGSRIASFDDYRRLRAEGIRACVDMKQEGADPWGFEAFLWLPTPDHQAPSQVHLRIGLAFLRECETAEMPVFVACLAGVGRSSTLVLAHLLAGRFAGEGLEPALEFLSARRPLVRPNPEQIEAARLAAFAFRDRG